MPFEWHHEWCESCVFSTNFLKKGWLSLARLDADFPPGRRPPRDEHLHRGPISLRQFLPLPGALLGFCAQCQGVFFPSKCHLGEDLSVANREFWWNPNLPPFWPPCLLSYWCLISSCDGNRLFESDLGESAKTPFKWNGQKTEIAPFAFWFKIPQHPPQLSLLNHTTHTSLLV